MTAYDDKDCSKGKETKGVGKVSLTRVKEIMDEKCHEFEYTDKKGKRKEYFKGKCDKADVAVKDSKGKDVKPFKELEVTYFKDAKCTTKRTSKF